MNADKKMALRGQLRERLAVVPKTVRYGSHNQAVDFKKWWQGADKACNNPRTTEAQLRSLINHYDSLNATTLL